ncbi:MAG TPA: EAL domain-containing protein, partial [Terracidiphilus sp.]|nr:EAL domain-containing protein [Terracidiphilus sp.]
LPVSQLLLDNILNWTSSGAARMDETVYATRCSSQQFRCVTASAPVAVVERGEIDVVKGTTTAGGIFGVTIGFAFSFLFARKRSLHQQLRRAIPRNQLQVFYQPIVVLATRQIVGAEALVRWTDDEGNQIDPEVFVKIAEERGFVGSLTKFVLRRALHDFASTLQSRPGFRLSINVAGKDLVDPAFLPMLDESLRQNNVKPESVVIEISEKSAAKSEAAMEAIRILRRMGHSIHIDDFGTGYSNLDKLLYMFADTIKIDKAFTGVIGTESVAVAILPQILAMAKSMGLEVVVEGVENDHQANYFAPDSPQLYGQGWLYGHPVTAVVFQGLLADNLATTFAAQEPATQDTISHDYITQKPDAEWIVKPGALHIVPVRAA